MSWKRSSSPTLRASQMRQLDNLNIGTTPGRDLLIVDLIVPMTP
jgi:hypothetical protein